MRLGIPAEVARAASGEVPELGRLAEQGRELAYSLTERIGATERVSHSSAGRRENGAESLANYFIDQFPQVNGPERMGGSQDPELRWMFTGSIVPKLLQKAEKVTRLDSTKLPKAVPLTTIDMPEQAQLHYGNFVRKIEDVDTVPVPYGQLLWPPFAGEKLPELPPVAGSILKDDSMVPQFQMHRFHAQPDDLIAINSQGRDIFMVGPRSLLLNKLQHTMYFPTKPDEEKYIGDFKHLLGAARAFHTDSEIMEATWKLINSYVKSGKTLWVPRDPGIEEFVRSIVQQRPVDTTYLKPVPIE